MTKPTAEELTILFDKAREQGQRCVGTPEGTWVKKPYGGGLMLIPDHSAQYKPKPDAFRRR